jgi:hypothetical protein
MVVRDARSEYPKIDVKSKEERGNKKGRYLLFIARQQQYPLKFSVSRVTQSHGENRAGTADVGPPAVSRQNRVMS